MLKIIEKNVPPVSTLPDNCVLIVDGMVVIQQADISQLSTFGELSRYILEKVLRTL